MDLTSGLLMTLAAFCLVTLRVLQQQNVIHRLFVWGAATSYAIAFADIALILYVVKIGWASALWIGTGGALGFTCALLLHEKFFQKKVTNEQKNSS